MPVTIPGTQIYVAKRALFDLLESLSWPEGVNGQPEVHYGPPLQTAARDRVVIMDPDGDSQEEWSALSPMHPKDERFTLQVFVDAGGVGFTARESDARVEELVNTILTELQTSPSPAMPGGLVHESTGMSTTISHDPDGLGFWSTARLRVSFWCRTRLT